MKKLLVALFIILLVPQVSFAETDNEKRDRLLTLIAELQALILELKAQKDGLNSKLEIPEEEFSSIILTDDSKIVSHYRLGSAKAVVQISDTEEREFFSHFYHLVPDEYDYRFKELVVFKERRETMDAFVETIPPYSTDDWRLGINDGIFEYDAEDREVSELFIHEFAHVLSYDGSKSKSISDDENCHEYFEWGCPIPDSYLDDFIDKYWSDDILDDLVYYGSDMWSDYEISRMFVTEYAATSPEEDFAESFSEFVVSPKPRGDNLAEIKTNFFYQYPELVNIRTGIRSRL